MARLEQGRNDVGYDRKLAVAYGISSFGELSQTLSLPVRSKRLNLKGSFVVMVYDRRTCRTRTYKTAREEEELSGSSLLARSTCHPATEAACEAVVI